MIHILIGNTGAGKTTYALQLKEENKGVIFSIDKWNKNLFLADKKKTDGLEWFLERINRSEAMIMNLIIQLENSEVDSILDLGFSKYEHRQKFRAFANEHGIKVKLHFLDISKETRLSRIFQRNEEKGATYEFEVTQENFEFMETWFEAPDEKEMKEGIVVNE